MNSCCTPFPPGNDEVLHTIVNVGGEAEWYIIGTGPNPFEMRTAVSSDSSVSITQNAQTVDFSVDFGNFVSIVNVGGFIENFVIGTNNPFELRTWQSTTDTVRFIQNVDNIDVETSEIDNTGGFAEVFVIGSSFNFKLRTIQSSDGSLDVTQNADNIDITVVSGSAVSPHFQVDTTASLQTGSSTYQTITTIAGDVKVEDGAIWKINMDIKICHPVGLSTVNTWIRWQIETASGVFTTFDEYQVNWPISILGGEPSTPTCQHKKLTVGFDAPRMRVQMRMGSFVGTGALVEDPRWGGDLITEAP